MEIIKKKSKYIFILFLFLSFAFFFILNNVLNKKAISNKINNVKFKNPNSDVVVSILGDSISTFKDVSYLVNGVSEVGSYYYASTSTSENLGTCPEWRKFANGASETWWMRFIDAKGYKLGINASYGGALVTRDTTNPYTGLTIPSFANRLDKLDDNGEPDFIFIFGGMNDLINIKGSDGSGSVELADFGNAYSNLIKRSKEMYPRTKFIVMVPYNYGNNTRGGYTEITSYIKSISNNLGVEYVDLGNIILNGSTDANYLVSCDWIHPTTYGMEVISNAILNSGIDFNIKNIGVPTCNNVTYNGSSQNLINSSSDYSITNNTQTNIGTYDIKITPNKGVHWSDGSRFATKTVTCSIEPKKYISVPSCNNLTYNGSSQNLVNSSSDYNVTNNTQTNAGTYNVIITPAAGIYWSDGSQSSSKTISCQIKTKDISNATIENTNTLKLDGQTLVKDRDYTYKYEKTYGGTNNLCRYETHTYTGIGNYTGTKTSNNNICGTITSSYEASLNENETIFLYTGSEIKPIPIVKEVTTKTIGDEITVTKNEITVTSDNLSYQNNINVGTATVTISIGSNPIKLNYKITPRYIETSNFLLSGNSFTYNGSPIKPSVTVTYGSTKLVEGQDYELSYSNNTNAGEANVKVQGFGNYANSKNISYTINPVSFDQNTEVTLSNLKFIYDGNEKKPNVSVKHNNNLLVENTDYTLEYKNNIEVGEAQVIVSGIKNYSGSIVKKYNIENEVKKIISYEINNKYNYDGKEKKLNISVNDPKDFNIKYGLKENELNLDDSPTFIDAGAYTIYYEISADDYATISGSSQLIIEKAPVHIEWLGETEFKYDGNKHSPNISSIKTLTNEIMEVEINSMASIGEHIATVTCKRVIGGQQKCLNYKLVNNTKNYTIVGDINSNLPENSTNNNVDSTLNDNQSNNQNNEEKTNDIENPETGAYVFFINAFIGIFVIIRIILYKRKNYLNKI